MRSSEVLVLNINQYWLFLIKKPSIMLETRSSRPNHLHSSSTRLTGGLSLSLTPGEVWPVQERRLRVLLVPDGGRGPDLVPGVRPRALLWRGLPHEGLGRAQGRVRLHRTGGGRGQSPQWPAEACGQDLAQPQARTGRRGRGGRRVQPVLGQDGGTRGARDGRQGGTHQQSVQPAGGRDEERGHAGQEYVHINLW